MPGHLWRRRALRGKSSSDYRDQPWSLKNLFNNLLKRIGAEDFPPVLLAEAALLLGAHRAGRQLGHFLDIAAGERRGVEEHDAGGVTAGVLPGVRHCARHERAGTRPADGDLVADLERHLAGNDPSDLVAFVMQVVEAPRTRRQRLLEQHDAVAGLPAKELQVKETTGRRRGVVSCHRRRGRQNLWLRSCRSPLPSNSQPIIKPPPTTRPELLAFTIVHEATRVRLWGCGFRIRRRFTAMDFNQNMQLADLGEGICILGPSNSGKSTLAETIARKRGLEVIHLDLLYHLPNTDWKVRPPDEFVALHDTAITGEQWVMDGNYSKCMPQRFLRATGLILLDISTPVSLFRYCRRTIFERQRVGALEGGRDSIKWGMILPHCSGHSQKPHTLCEDVSRYRFAESAASVDTCN